MYKGTLIEYNHARLVGLGRWVLPCRLCVKPNSRLDECSLPNQDISTCPASSIGGERDAGRSFLGATILHVTALSSTLDEYFLLIGLSIRVQRRAYMVIVGTLWANLRPNAWSQQHNPPSLHRQTQPVAPNRDNPSCPASTI